MWCENVSSDVMQGADDLWLFRGRDEAEDRRAERERERERERYWLL